MIKLTTLHYKIKVKALQRFHNINEHNESLMFDWESQISLAQSVNGDYPKKPFIEPFEFEDDDYNITEKRFRIKLDDIYSYKENADDVVELTTTDGTVYTIKETIEEIDALFEQ